LLLACALAHAQNCAPVDLEKQKADEQACRAAGGQWGRYGVINHLCNVYTCAERTRDGGKPCSNRADCQHQCVTESAAVIGAPASGRCTSIVTSFGCFTYVDGGRIVGRICVE
jgi:hypothetical protein